MTVKRRTERVSLFGRPDLVDSTRVHGGEFTLCTEQGNTTFGPLAKAIGEPVTLRVVAYCAGTGQGCKQRVGEVEEYVAETGEAVVLFRGRMFAAPLSDDAPPRPQSTYALLEPSHQTAPQTQCPNHGTCIVDEALLRREIADGRYREKHRTGAGTRKMKLKVESATRPGGVDA